MYLLLAETEKLLMELLTPAVLSNDLLSKVYWLVLKFFRYKFCLKPVCRGSKFSEVVKVNEPASSARCTEPDTSKAPATLSKLATSRAPVFKFLRYIGLVEGPPPGGPTSAVNATHCPSDVGLENSKIVK